MGAMTNQETSISNDVLMGKALVGTSEASSLSQENAEATYRLAKVFYDKADFVKAEDYFLQVLEQTDFEKDAYDTFKIYGFLIRIYSESMNQSEADIYIQKSKDLQNQIMTTFSTLTAEYFYNQGVVSNYVGDFDLALKNFNQAYRKAQMENEPELMAKCLYALAKSSYNLKKYLFSLLLCYPFDGRSSSRSSHGELFL